MKLRKTNEDLSVIFDDKSRPGAEIVEIIHVCRIVIVRRNRKIIEWAKRVLNDLIQNGNLDAGPYDFRANEFEDIADAPRSLDRKEATCSRNDICMIKDPTDETHIKLTKNGQHKRIILILLEDKTIRVSDHSAYTLIN